MKRFLMPLLMFMLFLQACNLPSNAPQTETPSPIVSPTAEVPTLTPAPIDTPAPLATPQNPLVLKDTLCWVGPGNQYNVVSALKVGTRLEMIGRGTIEGWWIVSNPIYKDACWVQAVDVQIEPGFDISGLKLIAPPPLPTPTWTPSQTPTTAPSITPSPTP